MTKVLFYGFKLPHLCYGSFKKPSFEPFEPFYGQYSVVHLVTYSLRFVTQLLHLLTYSLLAVTCRYFLLVLVTNSFDVCTALFAKHKLMFFLGGEHKLVLVAVHMRSAKIVSTKSRVLILIFTERKVLLENFFRLDVSNEDIINYFCCLSICNRCTPTKRMRVSSMRV